MRAHGGIADDNGRKEFEEKVRRGIFKPMERFIRHDLDDRRQEGLGQVWRTYQRNRELGKVLPDAVLAHSFRQRACDRPAGGAVPVRAPVRREGRAARALRPRGPDEVGGG